MAVRIDADLMIPGEGDPVRDATVVLSGTTIDYAGPRAGAPDTDAAAIHVPTVMPGLWDCHAHLIGLTGGDLTMLVREPQAVHVARATRSAADLLDAGVTSIREVGGYGVSLARVIDEGTIPGPTVYGAGAMLSTTGGHGDLHEMPVDVIVEGAHQGLPLQLCDGVDECLKAVRLQLRRNARVIKVHASGGVLSELDDPIHQQFSNEELRAIVEEAGRAGRVVAAHCHGKPGIMAALEAGVGSIEHGTYLDEEAAAAMVETGTILVSTRSIAARLLRRLDELPPWAAEKTRIVADRHLESMHVARDAGVTVAAGTDFATVGADSLVPHGTNAEELGHLVSVGYSPLEAIRAATATAPRTLGPQAPRSGRLEAGYDADVIALDADPLVDVSILVGPAHVTHVWKAGRAVRRPA
ncbi:metal-dependent hydrolase family protein [Agromyces binzhouensis]|uniref:Amidohydrolase family protein n=1 Tax=Agromyces binzhouensis TaxID=1817495 RepID=A0A4Q2JI70_9MICO|nr:amidohydrolase family protein [Agromyces binzhouensis]RXZ46216.1 amidohydrolase family protein [Agromyces binzhouensis]